MDPLAHELSGRGILLLRTTKVLESWVANAVALNLVGNMSIFEERPDEKPRDKCGEPAEVSH